MTCFFLLQHLASEWELTRPTHLAAAGSLFCRIHLCKVPSFFRRRKNNWMSKNRREPPSPLHLIRGPSVLSKSRNPNSWISANAVCNSICRIPFVQENKRASAFLGSGTCFAFFLHGLCIWIGYDAADLAEAILVSGPWTVVVRCWQCGPDISHLVSPFPTEKNKARGICSPVISSPFPSFFLLPQKDVSDSLCSSFPEAFSTGWNSERAELTNMYPPLL